MSLIKRVHTYEEEKELILKARAGDELAFMQIYDANEPFIRVYVKKYSKHGINVQDLYSAGKETLIKCMHTHDIERGVLARYLHSYLRFCMTEQIRKKSVVHASRNAYNDHGTVVDNCFIESSDEFKTVCNNLNATTDIFDDICLNEYKDIVCDILKEISKDRPMNAYSFQRYHGFDCQEATLETIMYETAVNSKQAVSARVKATRKIIIEKIRPKPKKSRTPSRTEKCNKEDKMNTIRTMYTKLRQKYPDAAPNKLHRIIIDETGIGRPTVYKYYRILLEEGLIKK